MSFDAFYARLRSLMGSEKPYAWATRHGLKATLANIDRYKHIPRPSTIQQIATASGCDYNWLATGEGVPFPEIPPEAMDPALGRANPEPDTDEALRRESGKVVGTIAAGSSKVDPDKLGLAMRALAEWEQERRVKVDESRRSAIIAILYDYIKDAPGDAKDAISVVFRALG